MGRLCVGVKKGGRSKSAARRRCCVVWGLACFSFIFLHVLFFCSFPRFDLLAPCRAAGRTNPSCRRPDQPRRRTAPSHRRLDGRSARAVAVDVGVHAATRRRARCAAACAAARARRHLFSSLRFHERPIVGRDGSAIHYDDRASVEQMPDPTPLLDRLTTFDEGKGKGSKKKK